MRTAPRRATPPQDLCGHQVESKRSLLYLSPSVAQSWGALRTLLHRSASHGPFSPHPSPPPLLSRLLDCQAEVAVWFALFLYVKWPPESELLPVVVRASAVSP